MRTSFLEDHSTLSLFENKKVVLEGIIIDEPDERIGKKHVVIRAEKLLHPHEAEIEENVRITLARHIELEFGDHVQTKGTIRKPENFENDRGIKFDYINFLRKDHIHTTIFYPTIQKLESPKTNLQFKIKKKLFDTKNIFISQIEQQLPSPHAELMNGLLLGSKQGLGENLLEKFRKVGLIHIVVLSGFNVMIVARFFLFLFSFFPGWIRFIFATTSIIFFAIMTGGSATTIRASIMAILGLVAGVSGRTYTLNRALFFAGTLMIFHNPMILLYDPSFQLSFIATFGLIHLAPFLNKKFSWITQKWEIREIVSSTIATQIAVTPLLLQMTGEVSLVSLLANILVLPTIPLAMLFGFLLILSNLMVPFISPLFMILSYLLLQYELLIVELLSKIPFASIGF